MRYGGRAGLAVCRVVGIAAMVAGIFAGGCGEGMMHTSVFEHGGDVGTVSQAGTALFSSRSGKYSITGAGANIWGTEDAFHYVYNKVSGDLRLTVRVDWVGEGVNPHRKAGWMIRKDLTADSAYVDGVVHGSGLTCLQYRAKNGGETAEIQSPVSAPAYLRLERHGGVYSLEVSADGRSYTPVGALSVDLGDEVYAGLVVCSHEEDKSETAVFSHVGFERLGSFTDEQRTTESSLETISVDTGVRKVVYRAAMHFEAPNWSRDGKGLLFNSGGKLYTIGFSGGGPKVLDTGFAEHCNNDHGFSPDGRMLAISDQTEGKSRIYTLAARGGTPRLITESGPSYWHGWSPDGGTLAYCAERDGEFDVYTIGVEGGAEKRLTTAEGLDDGPDYSPDGRCIYFNSVRSGVMHIWRMDSDGSNQVQITKDDQYADWFAHPSPDGKWIVMLSYAGDVDGHPANKDVSIRLMPTAGGEPKVIARLFGGQGTINVPSWSPDSTKLAFVSYRMVGK